MQSYELSWHTPGRIVLFNLVNPGMRTDVHQLDEDVQVLLDQAEGPLVHFLFEFALDPKSGERPDLREMTNVNFIHDPRTGWIIIITKVNAVVNFLISTAAQMNRVRFRSFETREEALYFLQDVDVTLPPLISPTSDEQVS